MLLQTTLFASKRFNKSIYERGKSFLDVVKRVSMLGVICAATAALMVGNAHALGLGNLEVESNLDQPLRGAINLRVAEGDDIESVSVAIASRDEFTRLGIDYPEYLNDITIELDRSTGGSVLRISSEDVVIREPFIQFLVRVDWSGGSFLREYTALIDPPTYAAETPRAVAEPQAVGPDRDFADDSEVDFGASDDDYADTGSAGDDDQGGVSTFTQSGTAASLPTDAQYGPVTAGESLGLIAEDLQRQFPDLSIYQIMVVLFEENPDAFIDGNINGLIKGAILNIGDLDKIRAVNVSDGRRFFQAQLSAWDATQGIADSSLSVASDQYVDDYASDSYRDSTAGSASDSFKVGSSTEVGSYVSSAGGGSADGEVIALRQQISELESSLSSSRLENQELAERISILETQLADMNRLMELSVEDAELASLEAALAKQNAPYVEPEAIAEEEPEYLIDEPEQELVTDTTIADELPTLDDAIDPLTGEISTDDPSVSVDDETVATTPVVQAAPVAASRSEPGLMEKLKSALLDTGIWRIAAGIGALLLGVLGLFIIRRRRADEEFEISMLSIGSQSQTMDDFATKSVTEVNPTAGAAAAAAPGGGDRDTSFLTVYTDTDAVVQADEVDPIAEADVYIAYGRDEQAEEVLLDGAANYPNRADIKHKLLHLYHKNTNVEGFERLAEELYAQRGSLSAGAWQEIVKMGKGIAPDNPIFEVSSDELATAEQVVNELEDDADFEDEPTEEEKEAQAAAQQDEPAMDQVDPHPVVEDPEESTDLAFDSIVEQAAAEEQAASAEEIDSDTEQAIIDAEAEAAAIADEVARAEAEVERTIEMESQNNETAAADEVDDDDSDEIRFPEDGEESSINLINFHDGRSEMSELDQVELAALSRATESNYEADDALEIDLAVDAAAAEKPATEADAKADLDGDASVASDISDFELGGSHDESRTQFELAKVFVDLGDEDGAKKILNDIIENKDSAEDVVDDANELLQSISG